MQEECFLELLRSLKPDITMSNRVVVTGMGVVAPTGVGVPAFLNALQNGVSGIKFIPLYKELHFNCQVCGVPDQPDFRRICQKLFSRAINRTVVYKHDFKIGIIDFSKRQQAIQRNLVAVPIQDDDADARLAQWHRVCESTNG